ncbi:hypothetical protein DTO195F2_2756 [Paecilomyces variotii]|nr:hypothetical protein DTO195F2_2756 [Paecilomyces variotii]KAJ9366651.1 hypothetical protein DTO282E5_8658 [Paecilomyces variotii]
MTTATFETAGDPQLFGNEPRNQSINDLKRFVKREGRLETDEDRRLVIVPDPTVRKPRLKKRTSPLVLFLSPLLSSSTLLHLLLILSAPITTAITTLIKITINMSEVIVDESGADSPLTTPTDQLEKCATDQNAKTAR